MNFNLQVKNIVESNGLIVSDAKPFNGAIKKVRASPRDNYFTYRRGNKQYLVKTLEQKTSGSAADKIAMFYLNLQSTPYSLVVVVADTTTVDQFNPLVKFFRERRIPLDNVQIMTIFDFKEYVNTGKI